MTDKVYKRQNPRGEEVEVLGETYEEGKPEAITEGSWQQKLLSREETLYYIRNGERYWYSDE